jgi:glycosyltransferase involved in cell wall biosynthesis
MLTSWHVLGSRQFGGADQFYVRLIQALNATGEHRAVAVNRGRRSPVAPALEGQVEQIHLPFANKYDFYSRRTLTRAIRKRAPDIVQTYMGRATRLTHIPKCGNSVHVARLGGYYKIAGYYEHADAWVGNTRGVCDYLVQSGLPIKRVYRIGNFVPQPSDNFQPGTAALRRQWNIPDSAWVVFSLGRLIGIKGMDVLLRAFAGLPEEIGGRPVYLLIAGDGPLRDELHQLGQEMGMKGRLRWLGWQNDPAPFFALADVMVCPSRRETLGNVILEAWSHRLPVIATRTPGAQELVEDGENGLLMDIDDHCAMTAALQQLLTADAAERARLGDKGGTAVQESYSRDAVVNAYLSLYAELAGAG